jgi:hypothetical protein
MHLLRPAVDRATGRWHGLEQLGRATKIPVAKPMLQERFARLRELLVFVAARDLRSGALSQDLRTAKGIIWVGFDSIGP